VGYRITVNAERNDRREVNAFWHILREYFRTPRGWFVIFIFFNIRRVMITVMIVVTVVMIVIDAVIIAVGRVILAIHCVLITPIENIQFYAF
jgi:hypothetical protein